MQMKSQVTKVSPALKLNNKKGISYERNFPAVCCSIPGVHTLIRGYKFDRWGIIVSHDFSSDPGPGPDRNFPLGDN